MLLVFCDNLVGWHGKEGRFKREGRYIYIKVMIDSPSGSVVKDPPAKAGDVGSIPGSGRSPAVGNSNSL